MDPFEMLIIQAFQREQWREESEDKNIMLAQKNKDLLAQIAVLKEKISKQEKVCIRCVEQCISVTEL